MYLIGKSIQADRLKEAEQRRKANLVRSQNAEKPGDESGLSIGQRLGLSLAARAGIVIALAVVLNFAG
jgi:hypothetical protein